MLARLKAISGRRRLMIFAGFLLIVSTVPFLGIQAYYGNHGLPESLFYHRTTRYYCIKCGSQAMSSMSTLFDEFHLRTTQPSVVQSGRIGEVDPTGCEHSFTVIAANERFIDSRSLRWKRWSYGKLEGDPLYSEPALVRAFVSLSRTNLQDSGQLFSYLMWLHYKGGLTGKLLDTVTGTNADAIFPALYQTFTNRGGVLPSQRGKKR